MGTIAAVTLALVMRGRFFWDNVRVRPSAAPAGAA